MKKTIVLLLAAAVCVMLLAGCGEVEGNPLPEGMEEETVLNAGRRVVELLNAGDYQSVYESMRSDGQSSTSPEAIQSYMEAVLKKVGAYQSETEAMATGQSLKDTGEPYATAVFYCRHEKKNALYRIAFSTELELMGFEATKK